MLTKIISSYILGSVEEINVMLDDNLMNLQSMAASQ